MLHLVIGDSHAKPGVSNERYRWAARLACEYKPQKIIDIGDWHDMPSLCSYDKGKRSFEGRSYRADIQAGLKARQIFNSEIDKHNRGKKNKYQPEKHSCLGNHEERIIRAVQQQRELDGLISLDDLGHKEYGWKRHDFLKPVAINQILYVHFFVSGAMGKAMGGENPATSLIKKKHMSGVVGHSHVRDFGERNRGDGRRLTGLVCGCYFEHDEDYAGPQVNVMWWRGLVLLKVHKGAFDPVFFPMHEIKKRYS